MVCLSMHNIGGCVRVSVSVCVCVCACMCVYVRDICRFNTPIVTLSHTYISSFCSNLIDADQWKYTDMGLSGVNLSLIHI